MLADVCGLDSDALLTTLGELFATALLVPDGDEVRFRHELGREVFYDELMPGGNGSGLHARLAESLQVRRPERLGEIARHWSAANDAPARLAASVAAGQQTLRTGAAAEAEDHLGRALELWAAVDDAATLTGLDHPGAADGGRDSGRTRRAISTERSISPARPPRSWPPSTRSAKAKRGCCSAICTASPTAGTNAPKPSTVRSPSSPSRRRRGPVPRHWPRPPARGVRQPHPGGADDPCPPIRRRRRSRR